MPEAVGRQQVRVAAGLVAVVAGLAGVLWYQSGRDHFRDSDGDAVVWDLLRRDVTAVGVVHGDQAWEVSLTADGASQVRCQGRQGPADAEAVSDLVDALEEARRGVLVPDVRPADVGLVDDVVVVDISAGRRQYAARIGAQAAVGGRTYLQIQDRILAVRGGIGDVIRRPCVSLMAVADATADEAPEH